MKNSDRIALYRKGLQAAVDCRDKLDLDPFGPIDVYAAATRLGIKVVFLDTSMEGFYLKHKPPRILISSLRPLPRRVFTCAHEIGHHWFDHGSTIDQLQEDERSDFDKPDEVLANAFAANLLMPSVGLRGAFARRRWDQTNPDPVQLFAIASQFGVGYKTLLNHMSFNLREINRAHQQELGRWTPQRIRRQQLDRDYDAYLLVDANNEAATFDVEIGTAVQLPSDLTIVGAALRRHSNHDGYELFEATKRGIAVVTGLAASFEVRVMPKQSEGAKGYVGAADNRFLEDPDEN